MAERKRSDRESRNFKARVEALKRGGKTGAEIAKEMGVTRQYVSQILIEAGINGRRRFKPVKNENAASEVIDLITRLEQQGQPGLAVKLREIVERDTKIKDDQVRKEGQNKSEMAKQF